MSRGSEPARPARALASIALLSALVTACATGVPTSPSATPSPPPSPSPSVDVAAAFVSKLATTNSANTTLTGTIDVGPIRGTTIHGTLSGTIDFNGSDYQSTTTTEIAGTKQVSSEVKLGADKYKKSGSAPWFKEAPPATGGQTAGGVGQFVKTVTSVQQAGTETVGARELVVLRPPADVKLNPADVGLTDPSIRNPQTDVEFLADAQGTPVLMRMNLSWTQAISGASVPVKAALEMAFDTLGSPVTIAKPDDVWKLHVSKRYAYRIAYPEGWEATQETDGDSFLSPEGYGVFVFSASAPGVTLNQWTAGSIDSWLRQLKARPQRNEAIKVGGQNARLLTYHAKINNVDSYFLDATVVARSRGYDIQWTSNPGFETAHRELFGRFLATVTFG